MCLFECVFCSHCIIAQIDYILGEGRVGTNWAQCGQAQAFPFISVPLNEFPNVAGTLSLWLLFLSAGKVNELCVSPLV